MSDAPNQPGTLKEWLEGHRERFLQALPQGSVSIERFIAAASLEILNNPKLQKCDRASLTAALMQSARYGLEVGALLGQAWIIPYNDRRQMPDNTWAKVMTAHFQIGYKGLIVLARRSKTIKTITAETVYENDTFEVELGFHANLTHKLDIRRPRGEPIAYYAAVELENGGIQFKVLTKSDAEKHRDNYSKGYQQSPEDNPWETNFESMALKTVIIKTLKLCPMSVEALEAVGREERGMEMRNVTGTGLDALPPPSEEAEVIREPVPEPAKAKGTRVETARAAAKAAAEGNPGKRPSLDNVAAAREIVQKYIDTRVPEPDQPWASQQLAAAGTYGEVNAVYGSLQDQYGPAE